MLRSFGIGRSWVPEPGKERIVNIIYKGLSEAQHYAAHAVISQLMELDKIEL